MDKEKEGKLFVVSTPIGNLRDVSLRALDVLRDVDYILCEDTRVTSRLLSKYGITTPLKSFYKEKERKEEDRVIADLMEGLNIALVSDAGTPLINDPGAYLVRKAIQNGVEVDYIPGPSAVISALVLSGFDPVPFTFLGFVPSRGRERDDFIDRLPFYEEVVVFFEAPHRIRDTLEKLRRVVPGREIAIVREISKVNQHVLRGKIEDIPGKEVIAKGEITVVLDRYREEPPDLGELEKVRHLFDSDRELLAYLKWRTGLPREKLYKWVKKL